MSLLNDIGFTAHVHFFQYNDYLHPVEIAIADVYSEKTFGTCVDAPYCTSTYRDFDKNNYLSKYVHKVKFPPPKMGSLPLDKAEKYLKSHYLWLDRGRDQSLAVRGLSQKRFFQALGFRVVDVDTDMFQRDCTSLFNYRQEKLQPETSFNERSNSIVFINDESHRHRVHVSGDDSQCAGHLAAELANWIDKLKLDNFQDLTNKLC
ncbi:hypothetical protein HNY73_003345 [Argiope bruennichi]|uniref:Uncharacterized protein n=1 Tax=Argiope bruennichi TaxID=94029 RepID=A0A8T0FWP3_ARGBR|nr:hypothetical protein HNY73_003345 [Argiope bruennichi]